MAGATAAFLAALLLFASSAGAGTTGKLTGRVVDRKKAPLAGVNVTVPAARVGAVTDDQGRYVLLQIPAGTWEVKFSLLGYRPAAVTNVVISADQTTTIDREMEETALEMKEVVVTAERPVVDVRRTSTLATVTRKEIQELPVQELQEIVNLQAGVVEGHFRGGRLGEVQFQVDGVSVNNAYDNTSTLKLDRSLLEEVQVISGTFDAEYGQAMSGVVNAVLRRGGEKFAWNGEALLGGYAWGGTGRVVSPDLPNGVFEELNSPAVRPGAVQNYQASLSGPTGIPKTTFLLNASHYHFDDWVTGKRRFLPADSALFRNFAATGDGERVPLGTRREWSGVVKLSNRSLPKIEIAYQAIGNLIQARPADWAFRLNPDGRTKQRTFAMVHGFDWTHTLSKSTFYTVALRQNWFDYQDHLYDSVYDRRYDAAGAPLGISDYEHGAVVQGVSFARFEQTTNAPVLKGSFVHQMTRDQQLKFGGEFQAPSVRFGNPGHLVYTIVQGRQALVRHVDEPPDFPGPRTYHPIQAAAFAQEDLEWEDLRIRGGLRFEMFDARSSLPSDLANPANAIAGAPMSTPRPTTAKVSLSPRLGISYPVAKDAALFFAYGHFTQMPALGTVFTDADYSVLDDIQAGEARYAVFGNPDIKPERTVQYQVGYKQALAPWLGLDVNTFYKDIRDLLGVEFIQTYNDAEYARLTNVDFGSVIGATITLDQRRRGLLSSTVDYTWQRALGNSSDPRETATRAEAGEDPRPHQVPLNWDQRHTLNLTLTLSQPDRWTVSGIVRVASGQPYTPTLAEAFSSVETNSARKPNAFLMDLRAERSVRLGRSSASVFGRMFNVFDTRFFNGFVFNSTGSPYYSRNPSADAGSLADPSHFYGPRRIEVGLAVR